MIHTGFRFILGLVLGAFVLSTGVSEAQSLKASHQWPAKGADVRDEMLRIFAREVANADVDLNIKIYPAKSLYKPKEQWGAMVKGQLDISVFPLAYASGRHAEFDATLMPGLVKNYDHARRLNSSPFMDEIKKIINDAGIVVLADVWLAGGFASSKNCISEPQTLNGQVTRAAGKSFEQMLVGAGGSIASMPSSEVYNALQSGVLDAVVTSSASLVSFKIFEQVKCLTIPGSNALWFMYEPLLMSKRSFDRLDDRQQEAILKAGQKSEDYFYAAAKDLDTQLVNVFKAANVEIVEMTEAQLQEWRKIAERTSYKAFAEKVQGGEALIKKALSVD
ncbi:TRAP transporter substrate-binding protein DctP [Sneathiella glossodoripedis]|uniref:TRAP transporter substrate-binding protein DctP n=1 Tax=Sneathiella glossodoripedis TaxID=418853 RepID=UPI000470BE28|nr:TRAP transporter substrate-binding protein DctP [Sneathiella glossodoripedis]